jgi:3-hydroxyisobutyrate dehydrogenase
MRKGAAWFDLTTNSPTLMRRLHASFAEKGIDVLDAPVSGGPKGAQTRKLALWIGGEERAFDAHRRALDAIGDQARYVGPIGAGSVAKLVHNCAGYAIQTALAEVFTMGVKGGVEPLALWEAVRQGAAGRRFTFDGLADQFLPGTYDPPAFALKLAHKDVTLATELARELGVPMRVANLALADLTEAMNRGWEGRDSRVAMVLQQERAGVSIRVDPQRLAEAVDKAKRPE